LSQTSQVTAIPEEMEVDALTPEEMQNVYQSFNSQGNMMADAEYQLMEMREAMMAEVESQRQQMLLELNSHQSASSQQNQLERQQMQQMVNEMREKTLKQEALIQAMQKNMQDHAQQGPVNAAADRSEQMSEAGASTVLGAMQVPVQFPTVVCKCGEPAMKLLVKKVGPTQGRSFWKCTRQICNFFQWDQAEVQRLLQMQPKAKASSAMTPSMPGSWQPVGGTTEVVDLTSESGI